MRERERERESEWKRWKTASITPLSPPELWPCPLGGGRLQHHSDWRGLRDVPCPRWRQQPPAVLRELSHPGLQIVRHCSFYLKARSYLFIFFSVCYIYFFYYNEITIWLKRSNVFVFFFWIKCVCETLKHSVKDLSKCFAYLCFDKV